MPDAASSAPLYERARETIRERIDDGTYSPGDRLPSESSLAEQFAIHRLTARRALEELAREGVVVARKGSGTYVAPRRTTLPISIPLNRAAYGPSLQRQLTAAQRDFREVLLDITRDHPAPGVPEELRAQGRLCRVRSALEVDGERWVYTTSWFTQSRVKSVRKLWRESFGLYGVILDQVGELVSLWRSFEAGPASPEVADELGIRAGAAVLVREGLTTDVDRVPLLHVRRHARADRVRYVIDYDNVDP